MALALVAEGDMSDVKLLPCPGCGLGDSMCVKVMSHGRRDRAQCICGWQGPAETARKKAIAAWNTRTLDPLLEQMAKALERSAVMLRAVSAFITENPVEDYEVFYDGAECDGMCLRDDCDIATLDAVDALAAYRASVGAEKARIDR